MDKRDYFMLCMREQKYKDKRWVIRAFSLVRENKTAEELAPLDIMQTPAGFFFKSPESSALIPITGDNIKPGEPLYQGKEIVHVKKGEFTGFVQDEETKYARVLYHAIVFAFPFGDKVKFRNAVIDLEKFEAELAAKLVDDDVPVTDGGLLEARPVNPNVFYCKELVLYYEAVAYSRGLAMLFVPAASPKTLTIDPAVLKRRDEIFNDPTIDLNDQAVAAHFEKELVDMDRASFEGDTASGFLISKKDFAVIRKKRFISFGSGAGLTPDSKTPYVKNSLDEGVDVSQFKAYNDEMRTGSFKRGVETMFGGELDKWLVRESSNMRVTDKDCGTTIGIPTEITEFNKLAQLGKYIVDGKGVTELSEDNIGSYVGKTVLRRSPAACRAGMPDYCPICLGKKLSMNPDALSIAFSQYGHDFMGESMSAMHGKALTTARMDLVSEAS